MNLLIDAVMARSRTVMAFMVVVIFAGFLSYLTIPKEVDPDIPIPMVLITISHPGISPEDAERLLIKPVEKRVQSIEGIKRLNAGAREGLAYLALEFDVDFDQNQALIDVREQVDIARSDLPEDTKEPLVREMNAGLFPILAVSLSGNVPERKLYENARKLQDKIEALPNVLEAKLTGHREELLEIIIEPTKLEAYNVTYQELVSAVTKNNQLIAAGALDTGRGRFAVKVPGLVETASDIYDLPIKVSGDSVVTLSDLADVRRTFKDPEGYARFNGRPAIVIQVIKRLGANIIETNAAVREIVDEESRYWPEGIHVNYALDISEHIVKMLGRLQGSVLTAICFVMIVVVAALGLRPGLMVGMAIPISFLMAFANLYALGFTLNMMVMFSMVLAVGMLVDGAIIVVEYADRKMSEGHPREQAYSLAAKRMFWPIVTSTLTTLAAFTPMLAWPGVTGKFMALMPITLIFVLISSLIMALFFLPVIGAHIGQPHKEKSATLTSLAAGQSGKLADLSGWTGKYIKLIEHALQRPLMVLGLSALLVASIGGTYWAVGPGLQFMPDGDPEYIAVYVGARGNLSKKEALDLVVEVESSLLDIEGIRSLYTFTGITSETTAGPRTPPPEDTIGQIQIELYDWQERRDAQSIVRDIRQAISTFPGLRIELKLEQMGPPVGKDVQLELSSDFGDLVLLEAARVRRFVDSMEGLIEIEDSRSLPGIEWKLEIDREQAGRFGADVVQVGTMVQLVTNGILLSEYRPDDAEDEVEIRVRYPYADRTINQLDFLKIQTDQGLVPISNFVTRTAKTQISKLERLDGRRVITIRANTAEGVLTNDKVVELEEWLQQANIDPRVRYRFRGADEEGAAAAAFLGWAMLAALFIMAIILLTQFNNFYHVFLTLSAVVLSSVGVLLAVMITGQHFSILMTGTGLVALAGIVVNNNIVLIDTYQRLQRSGYEIYDAVLRTVAQRLRPVLLTTITTICGLLPMALQINLDFFTRQISTGDPGSLMWVPLATAVTFGLAFSTLITLVLTPSLLVLPQHLKTIWAEYAGNDGNKAVSSGPSKASQPAE